MYLIKVFSYDNNGKFLILEVSILQEKLYQLLLSFFILRADSIIEIT